jgi:hypothetical protein
MMPLKGPTRVAKVRWILAIVWSLLLLLRPAASRAQRYQIDLARAPDAAIGTGLSAVSQGVHLADSRFVFVDRGVRAIMIADFTTHNVVTLGRTGEGPGEYRTPTRAVTDGAGGAIVPDDALGRAIGVSAAGGIVGVRFTRLALGGVSPSFVRRVNRDGSVYYAGRAPRAALDSLPIVRWPFESSAPKTIAWWPMVPVTFGAVTTGSGGRVGKSIGGSDLWPRRTAWVALPNEAIAIVRPEPYRVDIVHADGSRVIGEAVPYQPVAVTAQVKAAFRKQRGPIADGDFPVSLPRFEGFDDVIASDRNEVWVERLRPPSDTKPVYDIFDSTGSYLGLARLRSNSKVVGFGPGVVYVAREDTDDGLWYLARFRRP